MSTPFHDMKDRLMEGGAILTVVGETLRYELSYTPADGIFWLQAGRAEKAPYFSCTALLVALLECIGSWELRIPVRDEPPEARHAYMTDEPDMLDQDSLIGPLDHEVE